MVIQATSHIPAMIVKLNMLTMVMTTLSPRTRTASPPVVEI